MSAGSALRSDPLQIPICPRFITMRAYPSRGDHGAMTDVQLAPTSLGDGAFHYEADQQWAQLPDGWSFIEVSGVTVDSSDNVYVMCRGEHPIIVFDHNGRFLRS